MKLISKMFSYVNLASKKYNIDESHCISHSMDVLNYAHNIYNSELSKNINPLLPDNSRERIIYTSAIIHDMCDKKYMNESDGIRDISEFLQEKICDEEIQTIKSIIQTMSYSTFKKNGYPSLGLHDISYHIVREADLLSAYNFDRCLIYNMHKSGNNINEAFEDANELFKHRIHLYITDDLFIHEYAKKTACYLHDESIQRIQSWKSILN
jgi:hypothetical protein